MKKLTSLMIAAAILISLFTAFQGSNASQSSAVPTAGASAGGDASPAVPVAEGEFLIKLGHVEPVDSNENACALKFEELLEERSGGRIQVEVYPASQLGNENDLVESVKMNAVQITIPSAGAAARFYSPLNIFMMPFYLDGKDEMEKYHNLMGAIDAVWDDLNAGLIEKSSLRMLAPFWYGDRCVTNSKKPIVKAEDLKGLNIRVPDQDIYVQVFSALGATPTPLAFSELYMALSQGVVDGQDNPAYTDYVKNFYEVQKYLTVTGHITQIQIPLIGEKFYQSLPEDLQKMVVECMDEAASYASELQAQANIDIVDKLVELGMELSEADRESFVEATKDIPSVMLDEEGMVFYQTLQEALSEVYGKNG